MSDSSDEFLRFDPADLAPGIRSVDELPAKLYFRIGEVSKLTGLKQHVLRYWETEFPAVAPKKMGSNHRMYRRKDVEYLLEIKHLLYEKRFTIEGARKHLDEKPKAGSRPAKRSSGGSGGVVSMQAMPKVQSNLFAVESSGAKASAAGDLKLKQELKAILKLLSE